MMDMQPTPKTDEFVYALAKNYLPNQGIAGVTQMLVTKYLDPATQGQPPTTLADLYRRLLESAQNANMKAGVIGGSIGGVDKLAPVLADFDPHKVLMKFGSNSESLLDEIVKQLNPRGQVRRTPRSIWPHYCQTILSAAAFLGQFESAGEFHRWVTFFNQDARARASLPMLLSYEIDGLGFALACDFLKEIGYVNFPKPDVHLRDIFTALGLCKDDVDDYQLFKAIVRVAEAAKVTPYNADKVFWLIGSGYFYMEEDRALGETGRIGNHKLEFIEFAQQELSKFQCSAG
jgi:hypothetical protein